MCERRLPLRFAKTLGQNQPQSITVGNASLLIDRSSHFVYRSSRNSMQTPRTHRSQDEVSLHVFVCLCWSRFAHSTTLTRFGRLTMLACKPNMVLKKCKEETCVWRNPKWSLKSMLQPNLSKGITSQIPFVLLRKWKIQYTIDLFSNLIITSLK